MRNDNLRLGVVLGAILILILSSLRMTPTLDVISFQQDAAVGSGSSYQAAGYNAIGTSTINTRITSDGAAATASTTAASTAASTTASTAASTTASTTAASTTASTTASTAASPTTSHNASTSSNTVANTSPTITITSANTSHADTPIRSASNVIEFPEFMMQWPTEDVSYHLPNATCDTSDPTIPFIFGITDYPKTHVNSRSFLALYGNMSDFWDTETAAASPADNETASKPDGTVVCAVRANKFIEQFPHQMQHLVPCWSFWQHFPNATHVLLLHPDVYGPFFNSSAFSKGMLKVLEASGIKIVAVEEEPYLRSFPPEELLAVQTKRREGFRGIFKDNMKDFRNKALAAHGLDRYQNRFCGATHTSGDGDKEEENALSKEQRPPPRIGVFNREKWRHLIGAHNISNRIRQEFDLPYTPPVFFFEGMTFEEQMESFSNVDILLTPHGASLSGIPFMTRCSAVIEIFPDLYGREEFYGTLSAMAGVNHSFVYLGEDSVKNPTKMRGYIRNAARNSVLCASEQSVIDAVRIQIDQWYRCCGFSGGSD